VPHRADLWIHAQTTSFRPPLCNPQSAIRNPQSAICLLPFTGSTTSGTYSGSLTYGGTSIGTFSAAGYSSTLTVTLSGASLAAVQALIRAVTFNNTNTYNPSTNTRTLQFTLAGANQTVSCSVNIVAVNDAPQISLGGGVGYTERSAAVQIASAATVTDDVTTLVGRTITVSFSGTADSQATLAVKNVGTGAQQIGVSGSNITYSGTTMATFTGGSAGSPLVISVGSNASLAAIQAMVRQITYVSDNHNPAASYTLSVAFNDGDGLTTTANKTINVTAIDEPLDPHDDVIELVAPASGSTYTVAGRFGERRSRHVLYIRTRRSRGPRHRHSHHRRRIHLYAQQRREWQ
jgi:hypothetical protein